MASTVTDEAIINQLATEASPITGINNAYGFSENPDNFANEMLPALLFWPNRFTAEEKAHHNIWTNEYQINGILLVSPRMSGGGTLKFLENRALVFPQLFRQRFQNAAVVTNLLNLGLQRAGLREMRYGAGGQLLTYAGIEYIGFVCEWTFKETR